ncbi:MAG: hypothetical protein ACE5IG_01885 [Dehalococcoidia bacterium]
MQYWLGVGSPENWKTAFELGNTWGLKGKGPQATGWKQAQAGDVLLFYAVSPIRGLIGYGVIQQKLKQDQPLWPEEVQKNEVIWPLRLTFEVRFCLPPDRWQEEKVVDDRVNFRAKMGFRQLPEDIALAVLSPFRTTVEPAEEELSLHGQIVDSLLTMGRLQRYLCDREYPMERMRLDAVWRRVERSVPNFVFEVQIGGNPYQALAKLKHAHDLWNSNIYLVARGVDKAKIEELLSGTFHEIKSKLHVVDQETVRRLAELKHEVRQLEAQLELTLPGS